MLKLFISTIAALLIALNLYAGNPEKIYGKNRVLKPNEYNLEQIKLWKAEIDKNLNNPQAWYNFYRANRNAYIKGEETDEQKNKGENRFKRLNNIVLEMERLVPDTYEYNFVKWLNANNDSKFFPFLEKAHQLSPQEDEPIMSLIFYYEIKGDTENRNQYIRKYYELGVYSYGLLNYSYNMLSGLEQNAIIFTEGDKDTEATLLLQYGKDFRQDVKLVNLNLLLIDEYREHIFKDLGLPPLEFNPMADNNTYIKYKQTIIEYFTKNKAKRSVYAANTVSYPYISSIEKKMYLTGLASIYSNEKIDNMSVLINNIENIYAMDYMLKVYLPKDISIGNLNSMNGNYLAPFAELSKYFTTKGDLTKGLYYKNLARKVAEDSGNKEGFEQYFKTK